MKNSFPKMIEHIHQEHGILIIDNQPKHHFANTSIPQVDAWFDDIFQVEDQKRPFHYVSAPEQGLPERIEEEVIFLGGSSNNVEDNLPWMQQLRECIRIMVNQKKKILGVCFGHQVISDALGGKVEKGNKGMELGIYEIQLNNEGQQDPLFEGIDTSFIMPQVHGYCVESLPTEIPTQSLAHSQKYKNQALAIGENIRTLQFHPEISPEILLQIVQVRKDLLLKNNIIQTEADFKSYIERIQSIDIQDIRQKIFENFFKHFVLKSK